MENKSEGEASNTKTIYDAKPGEIFWKNFLAGFGHALGALFVNIILYIVVAILFVNVVLPKLEPLFTSLSQAFKSIESLSNIKTGTGITIPDNLNLQKILGK